MHLVTIGGSDAGISAALRASEVDPSWDVTVLLADAYPNVSICGLPYDLSGDVPDWHRLAHRTADELAATGIASHGAEIAKRIDTLATAIHHDMTVDAVSDLDLSYTPPSGPPWDAVQVAAQAWTRGAHVASPRGAPRLRLDHDRVGSSPGWAK